MTFNLGIFENHLEFHDYSHTHCVDDGDNFTNAHKSDEESKPAIFEDDPIVSVNQEHNIDESYEIVETNGVLNRENTNSDFCHRSQGVDGCNQA